MCDDGKIRTRLSAESYFRSRVGFATQREWESRRVECDIYNANLSANSLFNHLITQHDVYQSKVIDRDLVVDRELVGEAYDNWNLCRHFYDPHPMDLVSTPRVKACTQGAKVVVFGQILRF